MSSKISALSRFVIAAASAALALFAAGDAFASQGPGGGPGSASAFTQLAMAIIVYGAAGVIVGASVIGAARGR